MAIARDVFSPAATASTTTISDTGTPCFIKEKAVDRPVGPAPTTSTVVDPGNMDVSYAKEEGIYTYGPAERNTVYVTVITKVVGIGR